MSLELNIIDAGHGDCILLNFGHTRILIDCGPKTFKIRRKVLSTIKEVLGNDARIDIAIVTHNDDDHIGGFEYLIDDSVKIDKIIFNSLKDIPDIIKSRQSQISYSQDNNLRKKLLEDLRIQSTFLTRESAPLIHNNIKITAITPTLDILEKMHKNYISKEIRSEEQKEQKQISSTISDEIAIDKAIEKIQLNQDFFKNDPSITNKSSIGMVLEYQNFSGLFLGDAHATDVIEGLKIAGFENHKFDVVKLSHHGSERNTNTELLKIIGHTEYILCANKTKHNLPNNLTLARIINYDNNPTIHLSAESTLSDNTTQICKKLGFNIKTTRPKFNLNKLSYE